MHELKQSTRELIGAYRRGKSEKVKQIAKAKNKLAAQLARGRSGSGSIEILGFEVFYGDFRLFYTLFNEVFVEKNYSVDSLGKSPTIIDAGGNIGISTLFFKYFYPDAKILVFEPDSTNFQILKKNVESNKLKGVEMYNLALSDRTGQISLYERTDVEGGDIGVSLSKSFRENYHSENLKEITVKCDKLSRYIADEVDLLKIDIEGSEGKVIGELSKSGKLSLIKNISMEFHLIEENPLSEMLSKLERSSHLYEISHWGQDRNNPKIAHCILRSKFVSK